MPQDLKQAIYDPETIIIGHNLGNFDWVLFKNAMGLELPLQCLHDTMAQAYAHGLPGSLEALCDLFNAPYSKAKDKTGKKLIQLFCIPRKSTGARATRQTHPLEFDQFMTYARLDIEATRFIHGKMPTWNYQGVELDRWRMDQTINRRGVAIDCDLIPAAIKTVDETQRTLKEQTIQLTNGEVTSATRRDLLLKHILNEYGVELPDMQASTLEHRIADPEVPDALKNLLSIRMQATTSSTAKYSKIFKAVSSDGRLRGTLQWCGAGRTGRDAGRILNPQNLPRPTLPTEEIDFGIRAMKAGCADLFYDNVMEIASNAIRGVIVAPQGKKLLVADLSNIEGRVAAWFADERWKLEAFTAFDTITGQDAEGKPIRKGHDLYRLAYAKSFNVKPEEVTKEQRNSIGKTLELSMQFGGGVGAFVTFALNFAVDLEKLAREAREAIPTTVWQEAEDFWFYAVKEKRTLDLSKDVFLVCDSLKRLWRLAHPCMVALWSSLENAVRNAIDSPGKSFSAGNLLTARREGNWLRILLPGGRSLSYPAPRIGSDDKISFMGMDQYSRKWKRISTYGPKIFENSVQGEARNIFMAGVSNAENAGYACVMRVHDEQICEVPDSDDYTVDKLCSLMTTNITGAARLPLAAAGFTTYRYKKAD